MPDQPDADRAGLRARIAEALLTTRRTDYEGTADHRHHRYDARCALCAYDVDALADAVLATLPADEPTCICGHPERLHFEDVCITEVTGCDCGDYLTGEGARERLARLVEIAKRMPADRAAILREAANVAGECAEELRGSGGEMAQDREAGAVYVSERLFRMADEEERPAPDPEVVHGCPPDGSGLTPCCGRTPFELPLTDRISSEAPTTCPGRTTTSEPR
ncbi:hypothetical protein [Streptomyces sp. NPDC023838]|uniref:hypothetical protein n=1 Tax=Streptomyces sp. NPDC023838 TaxID=3154325 RepID=UPI0033D2CEEE